MASRYLHDTVRVGDLLDVIAPSGRFTFTGTESQSVALVAGGVGITPLMAQIRYLTDMSWPGDIHLVYSVKTAQDIVFRDELDALRRRHPNLHVTVTLTRAEGPEWSGERGRITPALLARVVPKIETSLVYICGPTEMTDPTRQMLRDLGVPDESIRVESFASPSRLAAGTAALVSGDSASAVDVGDPQEATLTFARSGKSTLVPMGLTVLEVAESLGVPIDYDCRAGICGRCKTRLLEGRVVMDAEDALDAIDRAKNVILSCQARCIDQVVLDA